MTATSIKSTPWTVTPEQRAAFLENFGTADGLRTMRLRARVIALRARELAKPAELPGDYQENSSYDVEDKDVFLSHPETDSESVSVSRAEGPPDLDYLGISDPHPDYPPELRWIREPDRSVYLDESDPDPARQRLAKVERATDAHRSSRARRHRQQAFLAALGLREVWVKDPHTGELELVTEERPWEPRMAVAGVKAREAPDLAIERTPEQKAADLREQCGRAVRWHKGRWRGARERFERTAECGQKRVHVHCNACTHDHDVPDRCSCGRVCLACREETRKQRNARFAIAQEKNLDYCEKRGLLRAGRRGGGAWGERMVTLTIPQVVADAIEEESIGEAASVTVRVRMIFAAWRAFSNSLRKWARKIERLANPLAADAVKPKNRRAGEMGEERSLGPKVVHYRSFEWEPGSDGLGHPHFHLWLLSPFLDNELVTSWWRAALAGAGLDGRDVRRIDGTIEPFDVWHDALLTNVRGETGNDGIRPEVMKGKISYLGENGQRIQQYIEGWSIIDVDRKSGKQISVEVLARLYEALDGPRLVAPSPKLLEPLHAGCQECGAIGWMRVEIVDPRQVKQNPPKMRFLTGLSPPPD